MRLRSCRRWGESIMLPPDYAKNRAMRMYLRSAFGKRTKEELTRALKRLALFCQEPNPQAKGETELAKAMKKQFTFWPTSDLLQQLDFCVQRLASFERKKPPRPPWKAFRLVDKRMPSLRL